MTDCRSKKVFIFISHIFYISKNELADVSFEHTWQTGQESVSLGLKTVTCPMFSTSFLWLSDLLKKSKDFL